MGGMDDEKLAIEVEDREVDPAEAQARREQWQLHSRQRALLLDLVEQETLPSWVLIHLIRMGIIVADENDALPCEYYERNSHWTNWNNDLRAYRERAKQAAAEGKWQEPPR